MHRTVKSTSLSNSGSRRNLRFLAGSVIGMIAASLTVSPAQAEPVFINQVSGTLRVAENISASNVHSPGAIAAIRSASIAHPIVPTAPSAIPGIGGNIALTVQAGINNTVSQLQLGAHNQSAVAILGGRENNVGVLQAGNSLRSQVALVNTQGLNVGVLQPNNSAPVSLFIARLPNGALLIKR
jgi:hypothetical protein